ncbi:hypothetical protein OJF2_35090 [Aquisphaera giovannonii]|uniref:BNR/Asp-box repeat protein n=1 Tax=Aquisphaera giovannonii TaxID=406548 RepID=A0A5B9W3Y6_9BACT|nr:sialidase family protein [Aquisphaera giovannonii]QEH34964.1 hypothetical protein OJF2_35090 [Aquisphaera giovannonii]
MRMRTISPTIILCLLVGTEQRALAAGKPSVSVGPNVQVSRANARVPHAEVVIAADPTRPEHLLAASMLAAEEGAKEESRVVVYSSSDGGRTWAVSFEPSAKADPALAFGPDGTAHLAVIAPEGEDKFRILVFRLAHGGQQWQRITGGDRFSLDRPFLAVGQAGPGRGTLYLSGTGGERTARSNSRPAVHRSEGEHGLEPVAAWDPDHIQAGDNYANGSLVVLSDGTVVTSYPCMPFAGWKDSIKPVLSAGWKVGLTPTGFECELLVRRIAVGGRLLEGQAPVQPHYLHASLPAMASDAGEGRHKDRVYLTWSQWDEVGRRVMLSRSEDRGAHWSEPVPLSEQPAEGAGYHAFLPAVAVNKAGVVAVSWYDTRERDRIGKPAWDLRLRVSADGGRAWQPSVRVTSQTSVFSGEDPEEEHRRIRRPLWLGDTAGLCADADGAFHPLWIDNRTGERQVWTAAVHVGAE